MRVDATLLDPASYTLTPTIGAPSTVSSVATGTVDGSGVSSVLLNHTGTTLGGQYQVSVVGDVTDIVGNVILPTGRNASFLSLGATPTVVVAPVDGSHVQLSFSEVLLPESEFTPGTGSTTSYEVDTSYPVPVTVSAVEHPFEGDAAEVRVTVVGMTSASYDLSVGPAEAISYDGSYLPDAATTFLGSAVGTGTSTAS